MVRVCDVQCLACIAGIANIYQFMAWKFPEKLKKVQLAVDNCSLQDLLGANPIMAVSILFSIILMLPQYSIIVVSLLFSIMATLHCKPVVTGSARDLRKERVRALLSLEIFCSGPWTFAEPCFVRQDPAVIVEATCPLHYKCSRGLDPAPQTLKTIPLKLR